MQVRQLAFGLRGLQVSYDSAKALFLRADPDVLRQNAAGGAASLSHAAGEIASFC